MPAAFAGELSEHGFVAWLHGLFFELCTRSSFVFCVPGSNERIFSLRSKIDAIAIIRLPFVLLTQLGIFLVLILVVFLLSH